MTGQTEKWRPIPCLPEYEASSSGLVRRRPYRRALPWGGERGYGGKAWPGSWDGKRFVIRYRGRTYRVARLVCEAFHGPAPAERPNCLHRDEDASNNRPENLFWGTQKENLNAPGFLAYCRDRGFPSNGECMC